MFYVVARVFCLVYMVLGVARVLWVVVRTLLGGC